MALRVVAENSAPLARAEVWAQHGLCLFVEMDLGSLKKLKVLMDVGASPEVTLRNADALNIDLKDIDLIFLSHGHYDHSEGVLGVLKRRDRQISVLDHPDVSSPKLKSKPSTKFIDLPLSRDVAEACGISMLCARNSVTLAEGVMTSGEIVRRIYFEKQEGFLTVRDGLCLKDPLLDDQALVAEVNGMWVWPSSQAVLTPESLTP
jgi:7,8-dihydropterin-6-yl-methyl-4-(beta-D-ribofuranosyl)aminobenzene 5'-phosphate synthase